MGGPRRWLWAVLLLLPAVGGADEVHLTNGGVVRGVIVERTLEAVVIETGPGWVTLPLSRITRIVDGASSLATFQERAAQIGFDDVEGLADLARWAGDHALATYSRHTWERVLALDPGHPEANLDSTRWGRRRASGASELRSPNIAVMQFCTRVLVLYETLIFPAPL